MKRLNGSFLVTGSTGFIGRRLIERLSQEGAIIYCAVYPDRHFDSQMAELPGVTPVAMSRTEEPCEIAVESISPEVVVNLASAGVDSDLRDLPSNMAANVAIVTQLIQSLSNRPPRAILHAGSWSEYAVGDRAAPITESDLISPTSVYGASKAAASFYGMAAARNAGIPFVNLRLFNVYGPGESTNRLAPHVIGCLAKRQPVDLTLGDQIRDLTYITDVVEAIWRASRSNLQPFSAYNVCSGIPVSVREVAETIADLMGESRDLLRFGARAHRNDEPMYVVGDNSRFAEATGWRPQVGLATGLRMMIQSAMESERARSWQPSR